MSDPVTNIDIEDVLSSIRRLVAQGDAVQTADGPAGDRPAPPVLPQAPGKLVLTQALRVDTPANAATVDAEPPGAEPATAAPAPDLLRPTLTDFGTAEDRRRLEQTIAELEAAVGGADDTSWDPDGSEATPVMDWTAAEAMERTLFGTRAAPQTAPVAEFDREVGQPDPDDAEADDSANRNGETLIDEDMLRDLIADVVREELQGALGERITRNVRKLVRREVYRVLSSQDFQ